MRNRTRLIAAAFAAASFLGGSVALAADCGPGVFEMANGVFFHPGSGHQATSCAELQALLNGAAPEAAPAPSEAPPVDAPAPPAPAPTLISAVERARQMLQARIDADVAAGKKQPIVNSYDIWVDVTLAVWDARTDQIALVHAGKSGAKLDVDPNADVGISVRFNNGVNSQFAVDSGDKAVVAVRYPIFKDVTVKRNKPRYQLEDVVYTPYSDALRTPEDRKSVV